MLPLNKSLNKHTISVKVFYPDIKVFNSYTYYPRSLIYSSMWLNNSVKLFYTDSVQN